MYHYIESGNLQFSPSDLTIFLETEFTSTIQPFEETISELVELLAKFDKALIESPALLFPRLMFGEVAV